MKQWEVWFAKFPYDDNPNIIKERPVIILNVETLEVLSVKVTTHEVRDEDEFDTPIIYWKNAGLKRPSIARISKSINLSPENFVNKKGDLHNDDRQTIMENFMKFIENQNK